MAWRRNGSSSWNATMASCPGPASPST
uniref:Uncharacterized protein n=1 Tax=Arundo donax TaxID=35708 RepID=A0A0A8YZT8_ARUDO